LKVKIHMGSLRLLSAIAAGASPILFSVAVSTVATTCQPALAQFTMPATSDSGAAVSQPAAPSDQPTQADKPTPNVMAAPALMTGNVPSAQPNPLRDRAVALAAEARLALNRGDVVAARGFIDQANSLKVPESAYNANQMRPWQVAMDVARAEMQRSSVQPAGGAANMNAPAFHTGPYQATNNATQVMPASNIIFADDVSAATEGAEPDANATGDELYRQGLEALTASNKERALGLFTAAWKKQADMDPQTRGQLKDKLSLLTQENVPAVAASEAPSAMQAVSQEQAVLRQKMFREVTTEIAESERMVDSQPTKALERLQALRTRVSQSSIEGATKKEYLSMVDRVLTNVEAHIKVNESAINQQLRNETIEQEMIDEAATDARVGAEIQRLVDEYNKLNEELRFAEAEIKAKQVGELAPNSELSVVMVEKARIARRNFENQTTRDLTADGFLDVMHATELAAIPSNPDEPLTMPSLEVLERSRRRGMAGESLQMTPQERVIREKLRETVSVSFQERPLSYAIETIAQMTGIPILTDPVGLAAEGLTPDQPVSLELNGNSISLNSALGHLLDPLNLTFVVDREVLKITSRRTVRKERKRQVYPVGDLVIPIPNFYAGNNDGMSSALQSAYQTQSGFAMVKNQMATTGLQLATNPNGMNVNSPVLGQAMPSGMLPMGSPMPGSPMGGLGMNGPMSGGMNGARGGAAGADFDTLIDLIESTIPGAWEEGEDTITEFASNLSLIVNAPLETHEQIQALLQQLRSLQNLQVTIEIRFISLSDTFFERMGVDFDFNIDDNNSGRPPTGTNSTFGRDDLGPSTSVGITSGVTGAAAGAPFTSDLDFHFRQDNPAVPPGFSGFNPADGASLGFAILSDIEMFFFLNAAQGDTRSNVMQAPKATMFDGQSASITDGASVPFVTGLVPVVGDFAVAQQPIIAVLHDGTQLTVQSVVTPDRRFVRMTLNPSFTSVTDRERTFTFTGSRTSDSGTTVTGPDGEPLPDNDNQQDTFVGSTVQLPTLAQTSIQTTVVVPDGGTILLGGIKRLSEGREERGVPMLSKIPYINRLFSNVGIGRDANTFMMTVTPRIIIPEEEEERVLGASATN
jgi:general secretion pathway protein D